MVTKQIWRRDGDTTTGATTAVRLALAVAGNETTSFILAINVVLSCVFMVRWRCYYDC